MQDNQVGIRELKAKLSSYLDKVKSGQTIVVTEHGKPIGQLVPIKPTLQEQLRSFEQAGLLAQAGKKLPGWKPAGGRRTPRRQDWAGRRPAGDAGTLPGGSS